ncbi:MAG: tetratricopeptide repeat protein, partial [Chthonomonadales bacterium]
AQNGYKHIPDDTTWNEWQQSRYSTNSLEPEPIKGRQDCMSCHMGKRDGIAQHESLSAGPAAFQISAALLTQSSTGNKQIDWMKPDTENNVFAHLGSKVNVDLLLTADRIGHAFPTVSHSRDVTQIEFSVIHGNSYPLTGFLHELGMIGITGDGEYAYCENFTKLVTPILRRQISPEAGDVVHLQFDVKEVKRFKITLSAELVRNIDGQRHVLAAFNTVLQSTTKATAQPNSPNPDRLYQYGLALLKQGDRTRARQMFKQCVALKPLERKYKTASVNAAIANGDFLEARRDVEKLLKETPNDPMARFQMGAVLRQMGQFQEALNWLTPLVDQHSGNRELLLNIGLCQLQLGKNEECEETFKQMCGVNPADATAHYNLMQVYLRQKKVSVARREEAIFRSLQEETPLQSIREPFLAAHPNIAEELKPNHVHLYPLTNWGQH